MGEHAPTEAGDLGPEGLLFVAAESLSGQPLLVASEVGGSTGILGLSSAR